MPISEHEFKSQYVPVLSPDDRGSGYLLDTYDDALNFSEEVCLLASDYVPAAHIWTVVDMTSNESDTLHVMAGLHKANSLGFVVTQKAWFSGMEEAIWTESELIT